MVLQQRLKEEHIHYNDIIMEYFMKVKDRIKVEDASLSSTTNSDSNIMIGELILGRKSNLKSTSLLKFLLYGNNRIC